MSDNSTCVTEGCKRPPTTLVEMTKDGRRVIEPACKWDAQTYVTQPSLRAIARLMTMTTSVMPAATRTAHTREALECNGLEWYRKVTSEHDGPTHVLLSDLDLVWAHELLRLQGWDVEQASGTELVVTHPAPGSPQGEDLNDAGLARAMNQARVDELTEVLRMIDESFAGAWSDDIGAVRKLVQGRRDELETRGRT